ncbi:MAG: hypothetical protein A2015_10090, partial [Spirochaetes bacterium GWF1_31_7]
MVKLIWSEKAIISLELIAEYISKDSLFYAKETIRKIRSLTRKLKDFPYLGSIVPEYDRPDIKQLIYKSYRIIYKIDDGVITILT